ncbi:MAG TPA: hypothetical protein VD846_02690, partial [Allosphingosinicella sp.]|nr:hypothetical protein [Allosphingosinicella sp.]
MTTTVEGSQGAAALTALPGGGFVVTWYDQSGEGGDDSGPAIMVQVFDSAGAKVGTQFLVNSDTRGVQNMPAVAGLPTGGFAVAWTSDAVGGADVKAQLFVPLSGGPTTLSSGSFVVGWTESEVGASSIEGRVFTLADTASTLLVGPGGFPTIQAAVDAARDGDTIVIAAGTYAENVDVDKNVTILGPNQGIGGTATRGAEAVIDGMVTISAAGVTVDGIRFVGRGLSPLGGHDAVVVLADDFTVTDSIFDAMIAANSAVKTAMGITGLEISHNLVQGYFNGIFIAPGVSGSVHDNRFQGDAGAFSLGVGLDSLSSQVAIADNVFDGIEGASIALSPFGPNPVDINSYVTGNIFTDGGTAHPVLILPTRDSPRIIGTDHGELFAGPEGASGYGDPTIAFSFDGRGGDDHVTGAGQGDSLSGGTGNDQLFGNGGNDLLDGGSGADSMRGGTGHDTYVVDDAGDVVEENAGEGSDAVRTSLAVYSLAALP